MTAIKDSVVDGMISAEKETYVTGGLGAALVVMTSLL
jgi:hypothetical protein